ncbi:putative Membrane protein involved in the export of O-antigen and teichoic acid [uncultured Desulfobacterium sp.]|uniref:Putative Membrane protein involved in the export of O-antigen and teichoic acid n=1 Tax=uncultured Desulfobacterium sp. TaxID=201089 RepID=A0A445MUK2_9BACT|nr:putative Membrane protein involved in the export of O-antigen and teichoic acid [uncultured Desulfobacterium sp.]
MPNLVERALNALFRNKIMFGVVSGWGSQIVSLAVGVFTMPLFFRYMAKDELGIWMFILGTGFFVNLADLGFSPVLVRQMAFELGKGDRERHPNYEGASYYFRLSQYVSSITSPILFIGLFFVGGLFLWKLHFPEHLRLSSFIAWTIFCLSQAITCRFKYLETTLNSHGEVGWQNWVQTSLQMVTLAGYFIALHFYRGGLVALTVVVLIRNILNSAWLLQLVNSRIDKHFMSNMIVSWHDVKPHIKPAMDMFLITFGAFLILNTDQYFITAFFGPSALPDYAAAYRLVQIVYVFASTASGMCVPFISRYSAAGNQTGIHSLLMVNTTVGMIIQIAAIMVVAVFGDYIIQFWLGTGHFVGWNILWVFCIMLTLENHHVIFARFGLSAKVDPTWGKISLLSGVINLVLTFIGIQLFGLLGVAMGTMISQMLTNNWYAVMKTLRIIHLRFSEYLKKSVVIWLSTSLILLFAMKFTRLFISLPLLSVLTGLLITTLICTGIFLLYLKNRLVTRS